MSSDTHTPTDLPAARDERVSTRADLVVVHPVTGEVLDAPASEPTERLAEWTLTLRDAERRLKEMRAQLEHELRDRYTTELERRGITHPSSRHIVTAGDYEIRVEGANESVWDPDDLEPVLCDLIDQGLLTARDVADVIRHETTVSRQSANRLLDRLPAPAHQAMAACRTWRRKGPGRICVDRCTPFPQLEQQ